MLEITSGTGESTRGDFDTDRDGSGGVLGDLRYLMGFVTTLLVYGMLPPVITGASILYAESVLGVTDPALLIGVGVGVGLSVYGSALVADRGVGVLTGKGAEDDRTPTAPPE